MHNTLKAILAMILSLLTCAQAQRTATVFVSNAGLNLSGLTYSSTDQKLLVTEAKIGAVEKVSLSGVVTPFLDGLGGAPHVAIDNTGTYVYVTDQFGIDFGKFDSITGQRVATYRSTYYSGASSVAVGGDGTIYIAGLGTGAVTKTTQSGVVTVMVGGISEPQQMVLFNGDLYLAARSDHEIIKITSAGVKSVFASGLTDPYGVASDGIGDIFTSNYSDGTITEISPSGIKSLYATGIPKPTDLAFDSFGNLYIASDNGSIYEVAAVPEASTATFGIGLMLLSIMKRKRK